MKEIIKFMQKKSGGCRSFRLIYIVASHSVGKGGVVTEVTVVGVGRMVVESDETIRTEPSCRVSVVGVDADRISVASEQFGEYVVVARGVVVSGRVDEFCGFKTASVEEERCVGPTVVKFGHIAEIDDVVAITVDVVVVGEQVVERGVERHSDADSEERVEVERADRTIGRRANRTAVEVGVGTLWTHWAGRCRVVRRVVYAAGAFVGGMITSAVGMASVGGTRRTVAVTVATGIAVVGTVTRAAVIVAGAASARTGDA